MILQVLIIEQSARQVENLAFSHESDFTAFFVQFIVLMLFLIYQYFY